MSINPNRIFKFHNDAGHAWLAVPIAYIKDVCTSVEMAKISEYSYMRGKTVYLEEDCDAGVFINAWKREYSNFHYEDRRSSKLRSPIRSYEGFSQEKMLKIMFPAIDKPV